MAELFYVASMRTFEMADRGTGQFTYYFNANSSSGWTNPANMNDGSLSTYATASTPSTALDQRLSTNTGSDQGGVITKVEIRAYFGYAAAAGTLVLTPYFGGASQGDDHSINLGAYPPSTGPYTGAWMDITSDTNAPASWAWSDVIALDCNVEGNALAGGGSVYVYQVEIRVTTSHGRPLEADGGDTKDDDKWFGISSYRNDDSEGSLLYDADGEGLAIKLTGLRYVEKVLVRLRYLAQDDFDVRIGIQTDSAGTPSGTWVGATNSCYADIAGSSLTTSWANYEFTFGESATLTPSSIYWLFIVVQNHTLGNLNISYSQYNAVTTCITTYFLGYKYNYGVWSGLITNRPAFFLLYGKSEIGYMMNFGRYSAAESMMNLISSAYYPPVKNDESTLYRTVIQIMPVDDDWKATRDAIGDCLIRKITGDLLGFYNAGTAPNGKYLWDNNFGPDDAPAIYAPDPNSLMDAEWNGTDALVPQATTDSPPVQCGDGEAGAPYEIDGHEAVSGDNWQNNTGNFNTIAQGNWLMFEFWFKVPDNFVVDDTPEAEYYNVGGGGGVAMSGMGWLWIIAEIVAGWTGKVNGVTNPAAVNGVAAANIAEVSGVVSG